MSQEGSYCYAEQYFRLVVKGNTKLDIEERPARCRVLPPVGRSKQGNSVIRGRLNRS